MRRERACSYYVIVTRGPDMNSVEDLDVFKIGSLKHLFRDDRFPKEKTFSLVAR
jgi:hypothetical protein